MTTIKQSFFCLLLAGSFAIAFAACNNAATTIAATTDSTKTDSTKMDSTKTKADTTKAAAAMPAPVVPFDVAEQRETLKDFAAWKPKYDSNVALRKAAGLELLVLAQEMDKPNSIMMAYKTDDMQKAKDFYSAPATKERMMKAGVIGKPDFAYLHVIRFNPNSHEKQWVEITHKVKNFAAWLKVYDDEGKDKRMSEGMVDVAMGRRVSDSNMVHLVFDITDMAKAKAALASPDKKKLMMSAGVMGVPKVMFFKSVE
jgi:hypothetical protein